MIGSEAKGGASKPFGDLINELVALIVAYFRQETIDPIRSLLRFVAFGLAGALCLAIGGGLLALAAVRAIQAETGRHLFGNFTWAPYVGGLIVAAVGAAWAASRIGKGMARKRTTGPRR
jgi:hypothetical protein